MLIKKALIIEDDVHSAKVLAHLLTKQDIQSIILTDVMQLKSEMDSDADIVFVDLEMPYMNGYEVLAELKTLAQYVDIPIIASSVHTNEINNVRDAGFHSFIGKPLARDRFPDQLARILSGESVWETS